ncbi:MAG: TonB-dependent receptor [Bacteroidales bacterium]|jgi:iron complex outermembrane receptor protein|nr:TonB-dependent receptor [Bacteroidales bacterium]
MKISASFKNTLYLPNLLRNVFYRILHHTIKTKISHIKILCFILITGFCYDAYSQNDTTKTVSLESVEVSVTSNQEILEQAVPYSRLETIELNRGTALSLDDAINTNVPGVFMERRTFSGGQQFNIRGYGNGINANGRANNFDSQGMKMYLNGIPITDAEGLTVMDDIDFGAIEKVEVIKGPSGTLYGLAIAGVVKLQTIQPKKNEIYVGQDFIGGSYGLFRTTTSVAVGGEKYTISANYGHQQFHGFMPHTQSKKDFCNVMGNIQLSKRQSVNAYLGYTQGRDNRNGELTVEQYETKDYSGDPTYIRNDAHSGLKVFRAGVEHSFIFDKHISNSTSIFGQSQVLDQSSSGGGWTDKNALNFGFRSVFNLQFNLSKNKNIVLSGIAGVELQKMSGSSIGYNMAPDSTNLDAPYNIITTVRSNQLLNNLTYSYFTQWSLSLPKGFSISAGIGISHQSLELTNRMWALTNNHPANKAPKIQANKYNFLPSPSFSIHKMFGKVASIYASYSMGYKAPVTSHLLITATNEINTGLKPERGQQVEIGTKGNFLANRLFYAVAVFYAQFTNKFAPVAVLDETQSHVLYTYAINAGTTNNLGVECEINYKIIDSQTKFVKLLRPFANVTYSFYRYGDYEFQSIQKDSLVIENYKGIQVAGVSPWVFNVGIDFDTKIGLYANINYGYRTAMTITTDGLHKAHPFGLLNMKIGYLKRFKGFEMNLFVGANNMTCTQYYTMAMIDHLPEPYIPGPDKINYYGGGGVRYYFK